MLSSARVLDLGGSCISHGCVRHVDGVRGVTFACIFACVYLETEERGWRGARSYNDEKKRDDILFFLGNSALFYLYVICNNVYSTSNEYVLVCR